MSVRSTITSALPAPAPRAAARQPPALRRSAVCPRSFAAPVLALVVGTSLQASAPSVAQEWGVEGGAERSAEMVRRYRSILDRRPAEGPILDSLLREVGDGAALEALAAEYRAAAEADPSSFPAQMMLGHLLRASGSLDQAAVAYRAAVAAAPTNLLGHRSLGRALQQLGDRDGATVAYEEALRLATSLDEQRDALRQLADLAFAARDWEGAGAYVERLVALDPGDAATRMELADLFIRHEQYERALEQYDALVASAGTDTRQRALALVDAGNVLALMGRGEEAVERYRRARGLVDPGNWLARDIDQRVVAVYRQQGRLADLVAEFEAQSRTPTIWRTLQLAALYEELGRESDAIDAYRRALRAGAPQDARLALIGVLERRGDVDAVLRELEALVHAVPDDASYRFRWIDALRRTGRRDDARRQLDATAARFSGASHVLFDVADRYTRLGERDAALRTYERLVALDPDEPNHHIALGEFHFVDGRRSQAERVWRGLLTVIRDPVEAHVTLGDVFANHGLAEEAVEALEVAYASAPTNADVRRSLARAYELAGRNPDALELWRGLAVDSEAAHQRQEARTSVVRLLNASGRLQDELPVMVAAFDATPPDVEAGYLLAEAYAALDAVAEVEATWRHVLQVAPTDATALTALDRLYTEQGRVADAITVLEQLAEAHPNRAREVYQRLAELSLRLFDDEAALRFAELSVRMNPDNAQGYVRLAQVLLQMRRPGDAVDAYQRALSVDAHAHAAALELAELLVALERRAEAGALLLAVVTESNDDVQVLAAGRRAIQLDIDLEPFTRALEPRLADADRGAAYLRLLVETYERRTGPLAQTAAYGDEAARAEAAERLDVLARRSLQPLLDALAGDDATLRRTALRVLVVQRSVASAGSISRLLDGSDPELRLDAAIALVTLGVPGAVDAVERAALAGVAPVSSLAALVLQRGRGPETAAAARRLLLARDVAADVRAFGVLGVARNAEHLPDAVALVQVALDDPDATVQTAGVVAAAYLGGESLRDALLARLEHGTHPGVAVAAAWSLAQLPVDDRTVASLATGLVQGSDEVRDACAAALGTIGRVTRDDAATDAFERRLSFVSSGGAALDMQRYLRGIHAWSALVVDAGHASPLSRYDARMEAAAASALAAQPERRNAVLLAWAAAGGIEAEGLAWGGVTEVGDDAARHAARLQVAQWVRPSAEALAVSLRAEREPTLLAAGLRVLREAAPERGAENARDGLRHAAPAVRAEAVALLARLDDAPARSAVRAAANDEAWQVRAAVADVLAGDASAAEELRRMQTDDASPAVRVRAHVSLCRVAPSAAVADADAVWGAAPPAVRMQLLHATQGGCVSHARFVALAGADDDPRVRASASPVGDAAAPE